MALPVPAILRFQPILQQRLWGGNAFQRELGRSLPDDAAHWGESWEISDRPEANSLVLDGPWAGTTLGQLWREQRAPIFGESLSEIEGPFPLLIKWLDCQERLSMQVHPPAVLAARLHRPEAPVEPKTETWFVAHAGPEAELFLGFERPCDAAALRCACEDGTVENWVQKVHPKTGELYHLPSGRIHALGQDLLIAEVQQNSDTTYRLWDWGRHGLDGKPRKLHLDQGLASIDYEDIRPAAVPPSAEGTQVQGDGYRLHLRDLEAGTALVAPQGECRLVGLIEGELSVAEQLLRRGDWVLLTATGGGGLVVTSPGARCLEVEILPPQS